MLRLMWQVFGSSPHSLSARGLHLAAVLLLNRETRFLGLQVQSPYCSSAVNRAPVFSLWSHIQGCVFYQAGLICWIGLLALKINTYFKFGTEGILFFFFFYTFIRISTYFFYEEIINV
jgi:hypothetical protein